MDTDPQPTLEYPYRMTMRTAVISLLTGVVASIIFLPAVLTPVGRAWVSGMMEGPSLVTILTLLLVGLGLLLGVGGILSGVLGLIESKTRVYRVVCTDSAVLLPAGLMLMRKEVAVPYTTIESLTVHAIGPMRNLVIRAAGKERLIGSGMLPDMAAFETVLARLEDAGGVKAQRRNAMGLE